MVLLSHYRQLLMYCLKIGLYFVSDLLKVSTGYQAMLVSGESDGTYQYWKERFVVCLSMYFNGIIFY